MIAPAMRNYLLDRPAVRFLQDHDSGRLETGDPVTGEVYAAAVHYRLDQDGSLLARLNAGEQIAEALARGGVSALSVAGGHQANLQQMLDEDGQPTAQAVAHVRATVRVEPVVRDGEPAEDRVSLRLRIRDLQVYLRRVLPD